MGARAQHSAGYRALCGLLRRWREDAALTQRDLARRLRKPPSFVHKSEVGDRRVDPLEFIAWCVACDREPADAIRDVQRKA